MIANINIIDKVLLLELSAPSYKSSIHLKAAQTTQTI